MEQSEDHKTNLKEKLVSFYNLNKLKILIIISILIIFLTSMFFLKANHDKKNLLIGQKYVQAGLYLSSKNIENSIKIYEEIIYSKNKFYSILALNTILEENLVSDDKKILEYFKIVEEANKSKKEQIDLITLKKALYLKKIKKNKEGDILLNNLIDNESKFKNIAEEIIAK